MSYQSTQAHLLAEVDRVDTIIAAYEASERTESLTDEASAVESQSMPEPQELSLAIPAADRQAVSELTTEIREHCRSTDNTRLRLCVLAETCGLSRRHLDVLMFSMAPELDEAYGTKFRHAHNRRSLVRPTPLFIETLFGQNRTEQIAAGALIESDSPLRQHDLIDLQPSPDAALGKRGRLIRVADRISNYLKGYDGVDPELDATLADHAQGGHAEGGLVDCTADADLDSLAVNSEIQDRLATLTDSVDGGHRLYWYGPATEKYRAVEAVCSADQYLKADLAAVLAADALEWLCREAALLGRPLHLYNATRALNHPEQKTSLEAVFDALAALDTDVFITGSDAWTPTKTMATGVDAIIEFPYPAAELRQQFWTAHESELPDEVDPEVLAGTFRLTHGQLQAALSTARSVADGEPTAEDIYTGCTAQSTEGLDDLAHRIEPESDWEEIQLRPETERKLRLVRTHIAQQARIYSEWGFAEQFSRGTGVVALFEGPSGTGKTMAAEILAGDVGMDLYRIDLSSVVSKYIGETEQNLEEIFEAATNSNAVLLFDEADAVFGDRAEVSDATDRYANAEVNYLLQRIENYDGVVVLTTNYASQIDSAFQRRLDHTVSFEQPQQSTRRAIWKGIFPDDTPVGDIDYEFLSSFDFTGGDIKQLGQTAAVLAADDATGVAGEDTTVEMQHLVGAIQLAFETSGRMVDPSKYEPYQHLCYDPNVDGTVDTGSPATRTEISVDQYDDGVDAEPSDRSPEAVVRRLFDQLARGAGIDINDLYHPRAIIDPPSHKQQRRLSYGDVTISGEISRERDDTDRVVLGFVQVVDGTKTRVSYELRPDDGVWRIFDRTRRSEADRGASFRTARNT